MSSPFTKQKSKKESKSKDDLFLDDHSCEKKSKFGFKRIGSLPYRLKFHKVADFSTPSKKPSKQQPASAISTPTPACTHSTVTAVAPMPPVSLFRKSERNLLEKKSRDEKYIEKLRVDIDGLNNKIAFLQNENAKKLNEIDDLGDEIENMKIAEDFLEKIAEQAIYKVSESDEKVKEILHSYDILLHHMDRMSHENENLLELNGNLTASNNEFMKINEERIAEMEQKLKAKTEELHKMKRLVSERNSTIKNFEFELGKKSVENYELSLKLDKSEEHMKIFEVQHEENLKMLRNSYENEIFFLNSQLSKTQNQIVKITKQQKRIQTMDLETQIDFENQKAKFEIERKNYDITIKNYHNVIEALSMRLKKSDTDVEFIMAENSELKSEILNLRTNYEKLRSSAENLKKNFDDKNQKYDQLMTTSEAEMIAMVSKMNDYFNEKFYEIAELKKNFDVRDNNLKKMTSTILEEYTIGIELAKIELDEKQKKIVDYENEIKSIKFENLQLKMKLNEGSGSKTTTLATIQEETATDDDKKKREEENVQLKLKVTLGHVKTCLPSSQPLLHPFLQLIELDSKFAEFENTSIQRENDYRQIIEQQRRDTEQLRSLEKLNLESNLEMRSVRRKKSF